MEKVSEVLDRGTIESMIDTFVAAWNAGDMEQALRVYAEDAAFATLGGSPIFGKDQIRQHYLAARSEQYAGILGLEVLNIRIAPGHEPSMATAMLRWCFKNSQGAELSCGFAMCAYIRDETGIHVSDDISF